MAQLLSMVMVVFALVPALSPFIGDQIIKSFGWRDIFLVFAAFGIVLLCWFNIRLGATFSFWFASIALLGAMTSILNAKLVIIYGMRCIVLYFLIAQVVISGLTIIYFASMPQTDKVAFALYFLW